MSQSYRDNQMLLRTQEEPLDLSIKPNQAHSKHKGNQLILSPRLYRISEDSQSDIANAHGYHHNWKLKGINRKESETAGLKRTQPTVEQKWSCNSASEYPQQLGSFCDPERNSASTGHWNYQSISEPSQKQGSPADEAVDNLKQSEVFVQQFQRFNGETYEKYLSGSQFSSSKEIMDCTDRMYQQKLYVCQVCTKGYKQVRAYRAHVLTHQSCDKYTCDICDQCLTTQEEYTAHLKLHGRKDLHECKICRKYFRDSCTLQTHMLIHTGEKPYKCQYCSKAFRQSGTLNRHLNIHKQAS